MKRHDTDPLALISGILFLIVGSTYLVAEQTSADIDARWVLPVALIAVGLAGLVTSLLSVLRRGDRPESPDKTDHG